MKRNFGLLGSSKVKRLEQDESARQVFLERLLLQALIQRHPESRVQFSRSSSVPFGSHKLQCALYVEVTERRRYEVGNVWIESTLPTPLLCLYLVSLQKCKWTVNVSSDVTLGVGIFWCKLETPEWHERPIQVCVKVARGFSNRRISAPSSLMSAICIVFLSVWFLQ